MPARLCLNFYISMIHGALCHGEQDIQQIAQFHKDNLQAEEEHVNHEIARLSDLFSSFQASMLQLLPSIPASQNDIDPAKGS